MFYTLEKNTIDIYYSSIPNIQLPKEGNPVGAGIYKGKSILELARDERVLVGFLNQEEISYLCNLKSTKRRCAFIYSRLLLKNLVAYNLHVTPKDIFLTKNAYGKPYLIGCESLKFNISHSRSFVACAATLDHEIGIDVEETSRCITGIAKLFFCKKEIAYLMSIAQELRSDAECRLWTMKESYIKALGKGLAIPFDSFDALKDDTAFFYSVKLDECCYLSVAVPGRISSFTIRTKEIRIEEFEEMLVQGLLL